MSYHFIILGTQDNPLFSYVLGTSKQGGDGQARFPPSAAHLNQFVLHSSLDIAEEVQWGTGHLYLKCIDKFFNNYISCFVTGSNTKFMLLHQPTQQGPGVTTRSSAAIGANPTSPQTEEAIRAFFQEVYESWVKTVMSPFYGLNKEIRSPVFRQKVAAAGRKYL
ncbi:trafficking protein particle complex subunit 2 [Zalerion maritima]|uniref:Trafficking protein particle complex subunit 2 n=1 Tax=Zalerion maritima TaxID=339359 RepID=A0AAD5WNB7_9PEZI|nr:trafficking protein particle complex subunit 2 [Zalerion maritima]